MSRLFLQSQKREGFYSPEIIDEEPCPDERIEVVHDWTPEEEELLPFLDEDHLALDVEGLVNVLRRMWILLCTKCCMVFAST